MKKIVVIGGGTGTYTVLTGLKSFPVELTDVVTMMDSGGSSGRLRDEFGHLPPGDVRQGLLALSPSNLNPILRELLNYRFDRGGDLQGHNFGNLFLTALNEITGSMETAIKEAGEILGIKGEVVPVTYSQAQLCADLNDGQTIVGEDKFEIIKQQDNLDVRKVYLDQKIRSNPRAIQAIKEADLIVIGPGDLYRSIIPNFLVEGLAQAVKNTKATVSYVVNLVTVYGKPKGLTAKEHVSKIEEYIGEGRVNFIVINDGELPKEVLPRYQKEKDILVIDDLGSSLKVIRADVVATGVVRKIKGDPLKRSYLRHDSDRLAKVLVGLV